MLRFKPAKREIEKPEASKDRPGPTLVQMPVYYNNIGGFGHPSFGHGIQSLSAGPYQGILGGQSISSGPFVYSERGISAGPPVLGPVQRGTSAGPMVSQVALQPETGGGGLVRAAARASAPTSPSTVPVSAGIGLGLEPLNDGRISIVSHPPPIVFRLACWHCSFTFPSS